MSMDPYRSCMANQPSTTPGTGDEATEPRYGITVRPSSRNRWGSAPLPARPDAFRACTGCPGSWINAHRSPPSPFMCCDVIASTPFAAMAASTALPPLFKISSAAALAS